MEERGKGRAMFMEMSSLPRSNLFYMQPHSDPSMPVGGPVAAGPDYDFPRTSGASAGHYGCFSERTVVHRGESSPYNSAAWNDATGYVRSPWSRAKPPPNDAVVSLGTKLVGSLIREEGHIYSLASSGELLYTGSDSKNIRVWKKQEEYTGFKSNSGLVKAIVIAGDRIFTGHQDGKIRVWRVSRKDPKVHRRAGALPTLKDLVRSSVKPSNYVEARRRRSALWIRHSDAVSCLSLGEEGDVLYSGSWDKTFKVWRVTDSKCLESVRAHDDALNAVLAGLDGLVFTGSADGSVKVWKREKHRGKGTRHAPSQTLLNQDSAVTALALSSAAGVVYSGSSDGLVNFWEMKKKSFLTHGGVLRGHQQAVLCLAAAGSLVLSGSADGTISVWRRDGGAHTSLAVLTGHAGPVKCLAVERDRESSPSSPSWIVYSGSLDKSVNVWQVSEQLNGDGVQRRPQEKSVCCCMSSSGRRQCSGEGASHQFASPLGK